MLDDELEVILGKVATKLRSPKQLMALSGLSHRFRRLVRQPAVWRELDVSQHRAYMTDSLLLRQIVRNDGAFSLLRRVNFSGCTRVTDAAIRKVLALSGKTLTHLYLEGCALLTTELVRYAATACPNLEVLDLTACASVDTLEVLRLSDEDWPKMRELELMDTGALAGRTPQETFERLHTALARRGASALPNRKRRRRKPPSAPPRSSCRSVARSETASALLTPRTHRPATRARRATRRGRRPPPRAATAAAPRRRAPRSSAPPSPRRGRRCSRAAAAPRCAWTSCAST